MHKEVLFNLILSNNFENSTFYMKMIIFYEAFSLSLVKFEIFNHLEKFLFCNILYALKKKGVCLLNRVINSTRITYQTYFLTQNG